MADFNPFNPLSYQQNHAVPILFGGRVAFHFLRHLNGDASVCQEVLDGEPRPRRARKSVSTASKRPFPDARRQNMTENVSGAQSTPRFLDSRCGMRQDGVAGDKWTQTGWRCEQKYANKVLIGNWAEERLQFAREPQIANSTNRVDYRPHWDFRPDVCARRSALLRAEGLPSKTLFAHPGPPSPHRLVTQYEESYGHGRPSALPVLPALPAPQPWHAGSSRGQPASIDRPISAKSVPPQSTNGHFQRQQSHLPSLSVYRSAYQRHPLAAFCQGRFARASRALSSHLHTPNRDNKDLGLRQRPLLQVPDHRFSPPPPPPSQN